MDRVLGVADRFLRRTSDLVGDAFGLKLLLPMALPMVSLTAPTPFWVAPSMPSLLMTNSLL
jgi:hypothetical protein